MSSEELAQLDKARRAVATGDFRAALQVIEKHARSFPKSQLGEEREALRVRALAGAGHSKKAGQAARDFESSYPKSVLVPELQDDDRTPPCAG
jgi:TolA-binding protein